MSLRILLAGLGLKAGRYLQQLPVFLLPPRQLVRFSRRSYSRPACIASWTSPELVGQGLFPVEEKLLSRTGGKPDRLLLLGLGGGREAVVFARNGYRVTGVDFVPGMVSRAVDAARKIGVEIEGRVGDIREIDECLGRFDLVWFSCSTYSSIPGRKDRIRTLARIRKMLNPGGRVVCMCYWNPELRYEGWRWRLGKVLAWITLGNRRCEPGDIIKDGREFLHAFGSREELHGEFKASGFTVEEFIIPRDTHNAGAVLAVPPRSRTEE